MTRTLYPAYEAEATMRGKLEKGGAELGYVIHKPFPECPGLPECDEMNEYGKKGMIPANTEDGIGGIGNGN